MRRTYDENKTYKDMDTKKNNNIKKIKLDQEKHRQLGQDQEEKKRMPISIFLSVIKITVSGQECAKLIIGQVSTRSE